MPAETWAGARECRPLRPPVEEQAPPTADSPAFFTPFFPSFWRSDCSLSSGWGQRWRSTSVSRARAGCGSCANDCPAPSFLCGTEAALELEEERSEMCCPWVATPPSRRLCWEPRPKTGGQSLGPRVRHRGPCLPGGPRVWVVSEPQWSLNRGRGAWCRPARPWIYPSIGRVLPGARQGGVQGASGPTLSLLRFVTGSWAQGQLCGGWELSSEGRLRAYRRRALEARCWWGVRGRGSRGGCCPKYQAWVSPHNPGFWSNSPGQVACKIMKDPLILVLIPRPPLSSWGTPPTKTSFPFLCLPAPAPRRMERVTEKGSCSQAGACRGAGAPPLVSYL